MTARSLAMARAVGVIAATTAIVTGITFASLSSSATLAGTTLGSQTADLTIWNGVDNFVPTAPGFAVTNIIPGQWSAEQPFYLKNGGTGKLAITAMIPDTPSTVGISDAYNNVYMRITNTYQGTSIQATLQSFRAGEVAFPDFALPAGAQGSTGGSVAGNYSAAFYIDPSAVSGSSASVGAFNITLTGTVTP